MANWFTRLFSRAEDGQPTQFGGYVGYYPQRFLPNDVFLTSDEALTLSAVWGCVQYISQSLSQCEIKVLDIGMDGQRVNASSDRVYRLLNLRPNPDTTAASLKEGWISQAAVWGDAFLEIRRDMAGRPYELYGLPSSCIVPKRVGDALVYEYRPNVAGSETRIISGDNIVHLRGPSLYSFLGESIVTRAARSIAIAKAADEFALAYYANNTVLGGVLTRSGPMDADAIKQLQENFEKARKGASKAHKAIALPVGVTYTPIDTDASKSQSVETRQHSVVDICRFFGVPPPLVGDLGRATWANLESLYIQAVRDCLGPWAKRAAEEIEWKLFGDGSSKWVEIDLKPLTQGDAKSRAEANQILRRNGVINANEWRELEGMDPIDEEGDLYIVEKNMTLMSEDALEPPEAPGPASGAPGPGMPAEDPEDQVDPETADGTGSVSVSVPDMAAFARWYQRRKDK